MIVLQNNRLNPEFLKSAALPNVRAILKALLPNANVKLRSRDSIDEKIHEEDLIVDPLEFRKAMWRVLEDEYSGSFHISLATLGNGTDADTVRRVHDQQKSLADSRTVIETGSALDIEYAKPNENVGILYLGEAEAELYEPQKNYEENIQGETYTFKAYRHALAPVVSKIEIGSAVPYVQIVTRAIHQGITPTSEVEGLRAFLERQFDQVFPPLDGIAAGIRALLGTRIEPKKYDVEEADGTKATVSCAPGQRNQRTEAVEDQLRQWDFRKGALLFDGRTSFRVDVGRALFSFGAKVKREEADEVIQAILAAA